MLIAGSANCACAWRACICSHTIVWAEAFIVFNVPAARCETADLLFVALTIYWHRFPRGNENTPLYRSRSRLGARALEAISFFNAYSFFVVVRSLLEILRKARQLCDNCLLITRAAAEKWRKWTVSLPVVFFNNSNAGVGSIYVWIACEIVLRYL